MRKQKPFQETQNMRDNRENRENKENRQRVDVGSRKALRGKAAAPA